MIVASPAREQTRARYPDEEGFVEREGVRIFWERYGEGRADDPLPADVGARPLTVLEDADPLLRAPGARRDLRPARQRALRQASGRSRVRAKRAGRVRRGGARRCRGRASGRRLMVRHGRVAHPCRRAPRSGQRPRLHRAGASGRRAGGRRVSVRRRSSTRTRAGQRRIAITGCATGVVTSSSSFRRCSRSRTRRSRSRTASAGGSRRMPRPCSSAFEAGTPRSSTRRRRSSSVRESGARLS